MNFSEFGSKKHKAIPIKTDEISPNLPVSGIAVHLSRPAGENSPCYTRLDGTARRPLFAVRFWRSKNKITAVKKTESLVMLVMNVYPPKSIGNSSLFYMFWIPVFFSYPQESRHGTWGIKSQALSLSEVRRDDPVALTLFREILLGRSWQILTLTRFLQLIARAGLFLNVCKSGRSPWSQEPDAKRISQERIFLSWKIGETSEFS